MQTDFDFELPKGYVDSEGNIHKKGKMRLATAADEINAMKDPRVQQNPGYLSILVLSRVITRLGTLQEVTTKVIEGLFTADLAFLQDMYQRINTLDHPGYHVVCPHCHQKFDLPVDFVCSNDECEAM